MEDKTENNILCIYHGNCADGFGAAWAVREKLGDIEFYPGIYGEDPPDVSGKRVIMVDFSYKRPVIEKMALAAKSILIIDHHKTAEEDLKDFPEPPRYGWIPDSAIYTQFNMNKSGAVLAWEYFHLNSDLMPQLLKHIQDRDLWKFELHGTKEIMAAVFSYPFEFEIWDDLMKSDMDDLHSDGAAIERSNQKNIKSFIKSAGRRMTIAGYDVPVLNAPYMWASDAGHIMAKGEAFSATYCDMTDGRVFNLRSAEDGIDVSEIAKKYGGGGHKHAAGYKIPH